MTASSVFDSAACLEHIDAHRRAFGVDELYPMSLFTDLVARSVDCTVECSCKIEGDDLHAARFNLWFQGNHRAAQIDTVLRFFHHVEVDRGTSFDWRMFREFYTPHFMWGDIEGFVAGVDLRANTGDSRLKIWFKLGNDPEKLDAALRLSEFGEDARRLVIGPGLLIGFDFFFDGRAGVKVYPRVTHADLQRPRTRDRLAAILPLPVLEMMDQCHWAHISFASSGERIVHCRPSDPSVFVERFVTSATARAVAARYASANVLETVVSVRETEILASDTRNLNLYFTFGRLGGWAGKTLEAARGW